MRPRPTKQFFSFLGPFGLFVLTVVAIFGFVVQTPAAWADFVVAEATKGVIRLIRAEGSLWNGRAELRIVPAELQLGGDSSSERQSFQLVRSVSWQVTPRLNSLALALKSDALEGPITQAPLLISFGSVLIPDGKLRLQSFPMEQAGGALALVRPQAALEIYWSGLDRPKESGQTQAVSVDIHEFVTSLSPIKPLGSYRVKLTGLHGQVSQGSRLSWSVASVEGSVISISGSGTLSDMVRGQLQFKCHRQCEFVNGLLSAIGKKRGDVYEAKLGI